VGQAFPPANPATTILQVPQDCPPLKHDRHVAVIADLLLPLKANQAGLILIEAGFKISEEPPSWVQPEVCFLKMERVRATGATEYFQGAPELAVEIVSPSERHHKIDLLLGAGSLAVWAVHVPKRKVRVYLPDGTSFARGCRRCFDVCGNAAGMGIAGS
jgi:Uma2 family endonuclease